MTRPVSGVFEPDHFESEQCVADDIDPGRTWPSATDDPFNILSLDGEFVIESPARISA
jgi:hypothetical protein